jgi:hypothetical protein
VTSVVVAGALASKPQSGGEAWVRLSYILGLRRLGFDVSFIEQAERPPGACVDWFNAVTAKFGVHGVLLNEVGEAIVGTPPDDADLLLNISGNLRYRPLLNRFRRRAYIDLDPGFTQAWHADGAIELDEHHAHFTVGENVGTSTCTIPVNGIRWRPTRPPVVLDEWPAALGQAEFDRFTTIATWRPGHGSVTIGGSSYGLRLHSFRRFADLPRRSSLTFEAALAIDAAETRDIALLNRGGWRLVDPRHVASDTTSFRDYVAGSGAEFTVAQEAYTATHSGWLGDRTARYLASGRPALVEDTGHCTVPTGEGLLTFRTLDEARLAADAIASDYERHSRAARALATSYFDSDVVLTRLLEDIL